MRCVVHHSGVTRVVGVETGTSGTAIDVGRRSDVVPVTRRRGGKDVRVKCCVRPDCPHQCLNCCKFIGRGIPSVQKVLVVVPRQVLQTAIKHHVVVRVCHVRFDRGTSLGAPGEIVVAGPVGDLESTDVARVTVGAGAVVVDTRVDEGTGHLLLKDLECVAVSHVVRAQLLGRSR